MDYKEHYIQTEKGKIYCKEIGKGIPIVFIHGGPGLFHDYFLPYFNQLAEEYRLIFFDQIGSGRSKLKDNEADLEVADLIESLETVKNNLNLDSFHCIGHSFGPLIAIYYAIKHPNDLISNTMIAPAPGNTELAKIASNNFQERITEADKKAIGELMSTNPFKKQDIETIAKIINIRESKRVYNKESFKNHPNYFTMENIQKLQIVSSKLDRYFDDYDVYKPLPSIKTPTLILHGDFDPIPFESSKKFDELLPNSKLVLLKDCGHMAFVEKTEEVMKEIDKFLKSI